jgi:hypothetical protein
MVVADFYRAVALPRGRRSFFARVEGEGGSTSATGVDMEIDAHLAEFVREVERVDLNAFPPSGINQRVGTTRSTPAVAAVAYFLSDSPPLHLSLARMTSKCE